MCLPVINFSFRFISRVDRLSELIWIYHEMKHNVCQDLETEKSFMALFVSSYYTGADVAWETKAVKLFQTDKCVKYIVQYM